MGEADGRREPWLGVKPNVVGDSPGRRDPAETSRAAVEGQLGRQAQDRHRHRTRQAPDRVHGSPQAALACNQTVSGTGDRWPCR